MFKMGFECQGKGVIGVDLRFQANDLGKIGCRRGDSPKCAPGSSRTGTCATLVKAGAVWTILAGFTLGAGQALSVLDSISYDR